MEVLTFVNMCKRFCHITILGEFYQRIPKSASKNAILISIFNFFPKVFFGLKQHFLQALKPKSHDMALINFQVLRAFGIPQKKHLYFISVRGAFLETSLPPTPNRSRFDLFVNIYSNLFLLYFQLHTVFYILYFYMLLGITCSTSPSFMGFCFSFKFFFAITLVLVWCVFLLQCEWCEQCVSCVFRNCAAGEASFSHVLRCWFCCSL